MLNDPLYLSSNLTPRTNNNSKGNIALLQDWSSDDSGGGRQELSKCRARVVEAQAAVAGAASALSNTSEDHTYTRTHAHKRTPTHTHTHTPTPTYTYTQTHGKVIYGLAAFIVIVSLDKSAVVAETN